MKFGKSYLKKDIVDDETAMKIQEICPSCALTVEKVKPKKIKGTRKGLKKKIK